VEQKNNVLIKMSFTDYALDTFLMFYERYFENSFEINLEREETEDIDSVYDFAEPEYSDSDYEDDVDVRRIHFEGGFCHYRYGCEYCADRMREMYH